MLKNKNIYVDAEKRKYMWMLKNKNICGCRKIKICVDAEKRKYMWMQKNINKKSNL